jgi:3D (Asp-Asp-Asp) domain-containing protein
MNRTDRCLVAHVLIVWMIAAPAALAQSSACGPQSYTVNIPQGTAHAVVSWSAPGSMVYASTSWDCDGSRRTASMSGGNWQFTVSGAATPFQRSGSVSLMGYNAGGYTYPPSPRPPDLPDVSGRRLIDTAALTASGPANLTVTTTSCLTTNAHWDGLPHRGVPPTDDTYFTSVPLSLSVYPYILGLAVTHELPQIPDDATVRNGCVQYRSALTGNVFDIEANEGVNNVVVTFQSDRNGTGTVDTITQPESPSDEFGFVTASTRTRRRGTAKITGTGADIPADRVFPAYVAFQEADYESDFLITAYANADENDFAGGPQVTDPPGLVGTFYDAFLYSNTGVLMQGTGVALNGAVITIDWNASTRPFTRANLVFRTDTCARGANNQCLTFDSSVAVDPNIIPMGPSRFSPGAATIHIDTVGDRVAQDSGDRITGRHIDLFMQTTQAAFAWGQQRRNVRYLSGGGACD